MSTDTVTPEELLTHCEILKNSESFQWWMRKAVLEPLAEADTRRSDLDLTAEQRTAALIEWHRLNKQVNFLIEGEETARRHIPAA